MLMVQAGPGNGKTTLNKKNKKNKQKISTYILNRCTGTTCNIVSLPQQSSFTDLPPQDQSMSQQHSVPLPPRLKQQFLFSFLLLFLLFPHQHILHQHLYRCTTSTTNGQPTQHMANACCNGNLFLLGPCLATMCIEIQIHRLVVVCHQFHVVLHGPSLMVFKIIGVPTTCVMHGWPIDKRLVFLDGGVYNVHMVVVDCLGFFVQTMGQHSCFGTVHQTFHDGS